MKLNILQQEEKIAQSNIENSAKLSEASSKLDKLEANLDLDCKDYTTKLQKIEVIIKDKDERIKELESVLNKLIDQRHILECEKNQLIGSIESASKKHTLGIDKARDLKERFERKLLVNQESSDSLELEKQSLLERENIFASSLSVFDNQIEDFSKLAQEFTVELQNEESSLKSLESISKFASELHQEIRQIDTEIAHFLRDIKLKESEIDKRLKEIRTNEGKIEEHERMIEQLETEKKSHAANKSFKEAQSTKDLIEMKEKFKREVTKLNEELKEENRRDEEIVEKSRVLLAKLEEKKEKIKERKEENE